MCESFLQVRLTAAMEAVAGARVFPWPIPEDWESGIAVAYRHMGGSDDWYMGDTTGPIIAGAEHVYQVVAVAPAPNVTHVAAAAAALDGAMRAGPMDLQGGRITCVVRQTEINLPYKPDGKPLRQMVGGLYRISVAPRG